VNKRREEEKKGIGEEVKKRREEEKKGRGGGR
jgi:hypothetical protein